MNAEIEKYIRYFGVAEAIAAMSKDPSTKVGALALDTNYNIIASGYNGFPRGVIDSPERYADRDTKIRLGAHGEQNLVAQAAYAGRSLMGSTILVTSLFPCASCAKSLIQAGVKRVISPAWDINPRWTEESKWSKILFNESSVEIISVRKIDKPNGQSVWEAYCPEP